MLDSTVPDGIMSCHRIEYYYIDDDGKLDVRKPPLTLSKLRSSLGRARQASANIPFLAACGAVPNLRCVLN